MGVVLAACNAADTTPKRADPTPTPEPTPQYSNETYAAALRAASFRLRGAAPAVADTQAVLAEGQSKYEELIDSYLDSGSNPDLLPSIRRFYRTMFMMGTTIDG